MVSLFACVDLDADNNQMSATPAPGTMLLLVHCQHYEVNFLPDFRQAYPLERQFALTQEEPEIAKFGGKWKVSNLSVAS